MFVDLNLPATLSATEDLQPNRFSLLYFKITSCFQFLHAGVKSSAEHCKPWAVENMISDLSATCRAMPESTTYLIETVRGIGLSIIASYFRNKFHQPKLQSILRHGNEIGKQGVFGLRFFNDPLMPASA